MELTGYSAESLIETGDESYQNIILKAYRTPLKERENKILYMSEHDYLTGALNRRRFEEIKSEMDCAEQLPLSVIMGDINGTRTDFSKNIKDVIVDAEAHMFKLKLIQRKSYRSSLISSIMAAMYARSQETEEHSKRLSQFSTGIGQSLNLTQKSLSELELLSMLHDIGKIGIPDHILNKPGKLTEDEWVIMKKHSEIGYRIILSSPELEGIADAYDAMTEDRVYRKALSKETAIEELRSGAGKQFDPKIVQLFVAEILKP